MESKRGLKLWIIVGLALVALLGVGFLLGWFSETIIGVVLALVFATVLAGLALKTGFSQDHGSLRAVTIVLGFLMMAVTLYPVHETIVPGSPVVEGRVSLEHPDLLLPKAGTYRILVHSRLGNASSVTYALRSGSQSLPGTLERVHERQRVGRGSSVQVPVDHDSFAHELAVGPDGLTLHLDSMSGQTESNDLAVSAFALPPTWIYYLGLGLVLVAGVWLESRIKARGVFAMTALTSICFGLILRAASPVSPIGPIFWSAAMAAGAGAIGGSLLKALFGKKDPREGAKAQT